MPPALTVDVYCTLLPVWLSGGCVPPFVATCGLWTDTGNRPCGGLGQLVDGLRDLYIRLELHHVVCGDKILFIHCLCSLLRYAPCPLRPLRLCERFFCCTHPLRLHSVSVVLLFAGELLENSG